MKTPLGRRMKNAARHLLGIDHEPQGFDLTHYRPLNPAKLHLLDVAVADLRLKSFADLGAVWNVDGGYSFYLMERHGIQKGVLVDWLVTEPVKQHKISHPGLQLIQGNLAADEVVSQVGEVDAVLFYDILLHMVNPDWDRVLEKYAGHARVVIVFNPQWIAAGHTQRLIELGMEEYFRNVPETADQEHYRLAFERPDDICAEQGRPYKDQYGIWQWGITDDDLVAKMESLGFRLHFFRNHGIHVNLVNFENHAFIFTKGREVFRP